jgi:ABC-type multidrug transport system ATPase subunit
MAMTTTDPVMGAGVLADAGTPPAVSLRGLSKNFGAVQAVRDVDLTIDQGEVVAFLGPNGAGKTSTIDMILGLSAPDVEGRRDFWAAIRHDADEGRTVLFATHYLEEADAYADRIVLIRKGAIVADGTGAQVKSLASGRTVRATLPGATEGALLAVPGADAVELRGDSVLIHSGDADKVARYLLTETGAHDLEITSRGLEEAFLALTGDDDNQGGNR